MHYGVKGNGEDVGDGDGDVDDDVGVREEMRGMEWVGM